jgi:uncharacterized protein DUF6680
MTMLCVLALYNLVDSSSANEVLHLGLKTSEWIMIVAVVIGPIAAVLTQIFVQRRQEKRNQKLWVFGTLMSNRATVIAPDFVRALNYIDVVFYKNDEVRAKWKALLNHYDSDQYKPENTDPKTFEKARDLTAELLTEMAKDLNYEFNYTHIKENAYYPRGHEVMERQTSQLREYGIAVLKGEASVKVVVTEQPSLAPQPIGSMGPQLRR